MATDTKMTASKAWGAGISAAIATAAVSIFKTLSGMDLDTATEATIVSAIVGLITWIGTFISPPNQLVK